MPRVLLFTAFFLIVGSLRLNAKEPPSQMRVYLQQRVLKNPDDDASHRLLGRLLLEEGAVLPAVNHLQIAVEKNPSSAAARFDLGRALFAADDREGAREQWQAVREIAPESEYAAEAEQKLNNSFSAADKDTSSPIKTAGYEIRDSPGPPGVAPLDDLPLDDLLLSSEKSVPIFLRLETGLLYNSNVALAPSSRQLAAGDRKSVQLFASPELEWWAVSQGNWTAGPLFTGYFTANEESFQNFNLTSYAPGLFLERLVEDDDTSPILRLEYRFGLDEFGGDKFSTRHSAVARLTTFQTNGATSGYLAIDQTNFVDDGVLPEVTSADGISYAAGMAREFDVDHPWIRQLRLGLDVDRLDTSGTDFAYWGAGLSAQTVTPLTPTLDLTVRGGLGYRIFDRYQFEPDRDEMIWRSAAELRKWFTPKLSMAGVVNYQMFDSNNPLFASDRMIAGVTMQYRY